MAEIPNKEVADALAEVGRLLAEQGANIYRVRAYEHAATTIRELERPVAELLRSAGMAGLDQLPGIGVNLAHAIRDLVLTGRLPMLERLRGEVHPAEEPTLLPTPAQRAHPRPELPEGRDVAVHGSHHAEPAEPPESEAPPIAELLEVDREYREKAAAGQLYRITPRLQNPHRDAWLPVLHTHRGERHYTALFSNTARAHQLGMTSDWVVIYYDGAGRPERQCTVLTARFGPLAGQRVVRGREGECASHYAQTAASEESASEESASEQSASEESASEQSASEQSATTRAATARAARRS